MENDAKTSLYPFTPISPVLFRADVLAYMQNVLLDEFSRIAGPENEPLQQYRVEIEYWLWQAFGKDTPRGG